MKRMWRIFQMRFPRKFMVEFTDELKGAFFVGTSNKNFRAKEIAGSFFRVIFRKKIPEELLKPFLSNVWTNLQKGFWKNPHRNFFEGLPQIIPAENLQIILEWIENIPKNFKMNSKRIFLEKLHGKLRQELLIDLLEGISKQHLIKTSQECMINNLKEFPDDSSETSGNFQNFRKFMEEFVDDLFPSDLQQKQLKEVSVKLPEEFLKKKIWANSLMAFYSNFGRKFRMNH